MKDITLIRITEGLRGAGLSCIATEAGVVVALPSRRGYEHPLLVRHLAERQVVSIHVPDLFTVPPSAFPEASELIARVNAETLLGSLVLDYSDGELAFHHAIPVRDAGLKISQVLQCIGCAAWSVDRYLAILRRLGCGLTPPELLEAVDNEGDISLDDLRRALEEDQDDSDAA